MLLLLLRMLSFELSYKKPVHPGRQALAHGRFSFICIAKDRTLTIVRDDEVDSFAMCQLCTKNAEYANKGHRGMH